MKPIRILLLISFFNFNHLFAQNIGVGTATPNSSAMLDISSTNKGILVPRVSLSSLTDAATIANPATSLLVYNTNVALAGGTGFYYNSGTSGLPVWTKILTNVSAGWSLTGNAGTDPAINFIGTTDNKPLRFRSSNIPSGFIDTTSRSTFFGTRAGSNHSFIYIHQSTGFGYQALAGNSGFANVAVGAFSMPNVSSTAGRNTAVGFQSLFSNIDGQENVAIGHTAMRGNTDGYWNVAIGDSALTHCIECRATTAIGNEAMKTAVDIQSGNVAVGYRALANSTDGINTAVGHSSLSENTTGTQNTAIGYNSMRQNLTGIKNVGIGYISLQQNTTGQFNNAVGYNALGNNRTGVSNNSIGLEALSSNISGNENIAIGSYAMDDNAYGDYNIGIGTEALKNSNNSARNIAIGKSALRTMSYENDGLEWAGDNTAIGYEALYSTQPDQSINYQAVNGVRNMGIGNYTLRENITGAENIAIGYSSLQNNLTGGNNIAIGVESMYFNTAGAANTSIGTNSMKSNTTGSFNTVAGIFALTANTTGSSNTAMGYNAGGFNNANTYCTFLGYDADQTSGTNYTNSVALGNTSRITASNQIRIGNTAVTSIGGYAAWSNLSDGRFKTNIREEVQGLNFIMALRPVTYNLDVNKLAAYTKEDVYKDENGKVITGTVSPVTQQQRNERSSVLYSGFIAQEVEAAAKKLNYDFSGVDKPKNPEDLYALRYSEFVIPLVKAVQEQQQEISDLKAHIQKLEELLNKIAGAENK